MTDYQMVKMYQAMNELGLEITTVSDISTSPQVTFNGEIVSGWIDDFREAVLFADAFLEGVSYQIKQMKE